MTKLPNQPIAKLEQELQAAAAQKDQLEAEFRELAILHHLPVLGPPYADDDQTQCARKMRVAWVVAGIVGVTCLAYLSMLALNTSLSPVVFFLVASVVGVLLLLLFEAAVIAMFRVRPKNPASEKSARLLLTVSAIVALVNFAGFSYLRFAEGAPTLDSLVSVIFVLFEISMYAMASAFRAYVVLNGWSERIAAKYEMTYETYKQLEALLKSYKEQLNSTGVPDSKTKSSQGEDYETVDYSHSDPVNGHARRSTDSPAACKGLDGKTAG